MSEEPRSHRHFMLAKALARQKGKGKDELSFEAGKLLYVTRISPDREFLYGRLSKKKMGWFPSFAVAEVKRLPGDKHRLSRDVLKKFFTKDEQKQLLQLAEQAQRRRESLRQQQEADKQQPQPQPQPQPQQSPQALPPGWIMREDAKGRTFYVEVATKKSYWQLPERLGGHGNTVSVRGDRATLDKLHKAIDSLDSHEERGTASDAATHDPAELEKRRKMREEADRAEAERAKAAIAAQVAQMQARLPRGWLARVDPKTSRVFFVELATKTSHWLLPESVQKEVERMRQIEAAEQARRERESEMAEAEQARHAEEMRDDCDDPIRTSYTAMPLPLPPAEENVVPEDEEVLSARELEDDTDSDFGSAVGGSAATAALGVPANTNTAASNKGRRGSGADRLSALMGRSSVSASPSHSGSGIGSGFGSGFGSGLGATPVPARTMLMHSTGTGGDDETSTSASTGASASASTSTVTADVVVIKHGLLFKKGHNKFDAHAQTAWQPRYFVLRADCLHYYKETPDVNEQSGLIRSSGPPAYSIPLSGILSARVVTRSAASGGSGEGSSVLSTSTSSSAGATVVLLNTQDTKWPEYYFDAETEHEAVAWASTIGTAMALHRRIPIEPLIDVPEDEHADRRTVARRFGGLTGTGAVVVQLMAEREQLMSRVTELEEALQSILGAPESLLGEGGAYVDGGDAGGDDAMATLMVPLSPRSVSSHPNTNSNNNSNGNNGTGDAAPLSPRGQQPIRLAMPKLVSSSPYSSLASSAASTGGGSAGGGGGGSTVTKDSPSSDSGSDRGSDRGSDSGSDSGSDIGSDSNDASTGGDAADAPPPLSESANSVAPPDSTPPRSELSSSALDRDGDGDDTESESTGSGIAAPTSLPPSSPTSALPGNGEAGKQVHPTLSSSGRTMRASSLLRILDQGMAEAAQAGDEEADDTEELRKLDVSDIDINTVEFADSSTVDSLTVVPDVPMGLRERSNSRCEDDDESGADGAGSGAQSKGPSRRGSMLVPAADEMSVSNMDDLELDFSDLEFSSDDDDDDDSGDDSGDDNNSDSDSDDASGSGGD